MMYGFESCRATAIILTVSLFLTSFCPAQQQHPQNSGREGPLREFLRDYLSNPNFGGGKETRYSAAFVDLKDDRTQEVIVYLAGNGWCGSGGCTMLILSPKGSSYDVVAKITIVRLPIRVLSTKSNDWHDIAVRVQGGGVIHAYDAKLSFNGQTYPGNPTAPPALRLGREAEGKVVVPLGVAGTALYR
jgi:hypothetical protein